MINLRLEISAAKAMELANEGKSVALVCSGDPGIYAMGSVVFELIDKGGKKYKEINVNITPSISAFQAASARVGAPFGNDFCIISLSNLLTPEDVIMNRLYSALTADFVIGIYNPSSRKRKKFFFAPKSELSLLTREKISSIFFSETASGLFFGPKKPIALGIEPAILETSLSISAFKKT